LPALQHLNLDDNQTLSDAKIMIVI
jgi:hypothetical protein